MSPSSETTRTILVVDDEEPVRRLTSLVLERAGYTVLQAASGSQALATCWNYPGKIDLLVSDIEMDDWNGIALASRFLVERPDTRVLLVSGTPAYEQQTSFSFLPKPFSPDQLKTRVAVLLAKATQSIGERGMARVTYPIPIRKSRWWWLSFGLPVQAAAVIIVAFAFFGLHELSKVPSTRPDQINLRALRGTTGEAAARKSLILNMDLSSLPRLDTYTIELVNEVGKIIWHKPVAIQGSAVRASTAGLNPGTYLVRVYTPAGGLLREYGLRVIQR